ncbi:hypothetical protein ACUOF8_25585, partial [Escherichia coli]
LGLRASGQYTDNLLFTGPDGLKIQVFRRTLANLTTVGVVNSVGTVAKLAMRQPFVLFKGLTFQKLCLPGAFRPGDHHNKMLRPG